MSFQAANSISISTRARPMPEADLLGALAERTAADDLEGVEQQVAAIEQRHREQVQQADRDREQRDQPDEAADAAGLGDLARDAGDPDRARRAGRRIRGR